MTRKQGLIRLRIDFENIPIERSEFNVKDLDRYLDKIKKKLG